MGDRSAHHVSAYVQQRTQGGVRLQSNFSAVRTRGRDGRGGARRAHRLVRTLRAGLLASCGYAERDGHAAGLVRLRGAPLPVLHPALSPGFVPRRRPGGPGDRSRRLGAPVPPRARVRAAVQPRARAALRPSREPYASRAAPYLKRDCRISEGRAPQRFINFKHEMFLAAPGVLDRITSLVRGALGAS